MLYFILMTHSEQLKEGGLQYLRFVDLMNWCGALLILLVIVQSFLIYPPRKWGIPLLSALHPVNALFIFLLPLYLPACVRQILRVSAVSGR